MYADARKKEKKSRQAQQTSAPATAAPEEHREGETQSDANTTAAAAGPSQAQFTPAASSTSTFASSAPSLPVLAAGRPLPCPPDATRLGRSTWAFLHSMAAYYPPAADATQQQHASRLLHSLSSLYPCDHCAAHLSTYYQADPPERHVAGRAALSGYLCRVHNDVRARQGKRLFDCGRVFERWGGHDWEDTHSDETCDKREYGDVEDQQQAAG